MLGVCLCTSVWKCVWMCAECPCKSEDDFRSPGAEATVCWDLPYVGVRNWTQILRKSSKFSLVKNSKRYQIFDAALWNVCLHNSYYNFATVYHKLNSSSQWGSHFSYGFGLTCLEIVPSQVRWAFLFQLSIKKIF